MYACIHETGTTFFEGCALGRFGYLLLATHPHRLSIRELISTHLAACAKRDVACPRPFWQPIVP